MNKLENEGFGFEAGRHLRWKAHEGWHLGLGRHQWHRPGRQIPKARHWSNQQNIFLSRLKYVSPCCPTPNSLSCFFSLTHTLYRRHALCLMQFKRHQLMPHRIGGQLLWSAFIMISVSLLPIVVTTVIAKNSDPWMFQLLGCFSFSNPALSVSSNRLTKFVRLSSGTEGNASANAYLHRSKTWGIGTEGITGYIHPPQKKSGYLMIQ